jgi:chromosomal replication initiator protein
MAVTSVEQAAQGVWARVTEKARNELPESSFAMWFSEVRPASLEGDVLQLAVPSEYVRDWLVRHYLPLIQTAASEATGSPLRIHVVAEPAERPAAQDSPEPAVAIPDAAPRSTSRASG